MRIRRANSAVRVAAVLWLPALVLGDTYPRQAGIDARHYVFRLSLTDDSGEIAGVATADILFVAPDVTSVVLDLASSMKVSEVAPGSYTHIGDRLAIQLSAAPRPGEHRVFTIKYRGTPKSGLRIGKNKYEERSFFSLNWPNLAHQWLPIIDHPSDKATSEFLVTAPAHYTVVANGLLQEETDLGDGRRMTHWKQSVPIASWLNAIGVAKFASNHFGAVSGIPLQNWVYHQDREMGIEAFETPTRKAMEFYISHVGPYPYEKLANVVAAGLSGGTEHASAIFYGERSITNRAATGLVAHEIAHQWFGDSVTEKDWDDVWLSEGFATYFTLLATEHYEGREAFVAGLKRSRESVFAQEKRLPGVAVIHNNLADMTKVLNQLVYQKGGWTLHMLRGRMGTAAFWAGIQDYYRRYRDRNASTEDFRRVMEEHGAVDLGWFFEQWLKRAGSPVVDGGWRYNATAKKVEIDLMQRGEVYRLPVEISIGGKVEKVELTQQSQRFEIAAEKEPDAVVLDPNSWVLMNGTFIKR